MTHIGSKAALLLFIALNCTMSLGQQTSLSGVVRDREDKSPIRGAEVKVGAKVEGVTGVDGKYVVSNLPRRAKVEVTYTKQGYGARTEQIMLKDERIQEDVALFKNTADTVYWSNWSENLRKEVQAQGSGSQSQSEQYTRQWKEVEEAGLTDDAKKAAAQQLITVFPSQSDVPTGLQAYAIEGLRKEAIHTRDQEVNAQIQTNQANRAQIVANRDDVAANKQEIKAYQHLTPNGDKVRINGTITGRTGETLTVKSVDAGTVIVALNDDTKVQQPKGLGLSKRQMSATVLIPGLKVSVEGVGDAQSRVVAKTINFSSEDLEMAEAVQAGLTPTKHAVATNAQNIAANKQATKTNAQEIAANQVQTAANMQSIANNQEQTAANLQDILATTKRFSELSEYDTKGDAVVNFAVGSSAISASDKATLKQLAQTAVGLTGYIIQVKGFADTSGNATMNQKLSMDRAQEVIAYLVQDCKVPVRHIVAPGAMGTVDPSAPNETSQGRAENRRVEVKVLVNRGLSGQ